MKKELRILTQKELWNAMGFPQDYIIDRQYRRKEIGGYICLTEEELKEEVAV